MEIIKKIRIRRLYKLLFDPIVKESGEKMYNVKGIAPEIAKLDRLDEKQINREFVIVFLNPTSSNSRRRINDALLVSRDNEGLKFFKLTALEYKMLDKTVRTGDIIKVSKEAQSFEIKRSGEMSDFDIAKLLGSIWGQKKDDKSLEAITQRVHDLSKFIVFERMTSLAGAAINSYIDPNDVGKQLKDLNSDYQKMELEKFIDKYEKVYNLNKEDMEKLQSLSIEICEPQKVEPVKVSEETKQGISL